MSNIKPEIIKKLKDNDQTLTKLDLSSQGLNASDIAILLDAIKNNDHLRSLNISSNNIGQEGAKALARNTSLTSLDLTNNLNMGFCVSDFFNNTTLIDFKMSGFSVFDGQAKQALQKHVALNKKAKELQFIEQVIEIAKGTRPTQEKSLLRHLSDAHLLLIFSYVAGNALRKPDHVVEVSRFLLTTIKLATKGTLNWPRANQQAKFFKHWDEKTWKEVESRLPKKSATPSGTPSTNPGP
jgi:hypothetical protein